MGDAKFLMMQMLVYVHYCLNHAILFPWKALIITTVEY